MEDLYPMATGHGYHTSRPYIRQIHKTFLWKFQVLILRIAYYIKHSAAFLKPVFHPSGRIIDDGVSASFSCTNFNGCQQFRNKKTAWNNCSFHCGTITYCMQLQLFQYLILTFRLYESVSHPYLISVASIHRKGLRTKVHRPHRHTFIFIYVSYYIPLKKLQGKKSG